MKQLNQRQQNILSFLLKSGMVSNADIVTHMEGEVSRFTVLRELDLLLKEGLIVKSGKGRAISYSLRSNRKINTFFDLDSYFKDGPDKRDVKDFNPMIINELHDLFSEEEVGKLIEVNNRYLKRLEDRTDNFLKREIERITIELSWKSSQIEGNTYSLIDTELLIRDRIEPVGHKKEEAIMILNHKSAIDYIFSHNNEFKKIELFHIEKIHELLTRGMGVKKGVRDDVLRIIGTRFMPMEGRLNIIELLNRSIDKINTMQDPFSKALSIILMVSYIQPFEDGNKRAARILGNAILLANNACPLSYRSIDEGYYKKAILMFYEQNSALAFKELFIEQFNFAVDNYF